MAVDPANAKRIHEMDRALAGAEQTAKGGMAFFFGVLQCFEEQQRLTGHGAPMEERYRVATELTQSWLGSLMAAAIHLRKRGTGED